jgi:hypothetical protein
MSIPESDHDQHLRALFGGLDTKADFDLRLMARLQAERQAEAIGRAALAREQERARYRREVLRLQSWRRLMLRVLTLDILGIAALLVVAIGAARPLFGVDVIDILRQDGPYILIAFSILIGGVPLVVMWAEQSRTPVRLL